MIQKIIDTNIFLRHLLQDIPDQAEVATSIINEIEAGKITGLVSILVINELIWILQHYYQLKRGVYIPKLLKLITLNDLKIMETKKEIIEDILEKMQRKNIDFTDIYLRAVSRGQEVLSFDRDFSRV